MDRDTKMRFEGKFDQLKGRVKESWGALSDDDVKRSEGKWDQLVGTIRQKTGETTEKIELKLKQLLS